MRYRVYDNEKKKHADLSKFYLMGDGSLWHEIRCDIGAETIIPTLEPADPKRYTVEYSTEKEDCKGKEIFQKDRVKATMPSSANERGETIECIVEYDSNSTKYKLCEYNEKGELWDEYPIHDDVKIKVTGNIHDSKEK